MANVSERSSALAGTVSLSKFQQDLVLSVCPDGTRILSAHNIRDGLPPRPLRVRVSRPSEGEQALVLRMDRSLQGVEKEARILPALAELGLPVPRVLAGPVTDPTQPHLGPMTVLTALPGVDLTTLGKVASPQQRKQLQEYLLIGIATLQRATAALFNDPRAASLPRRDLPRVFRGLLRQPSPWFNHPLVKQAVQQLIPLVNEARAPLAFSNGDFDPGGFLLQWRELSGFLGFAWSCFEDPLWSIARYRFLEGLPYDAEAIGNRYVELTGFAQTDLDLRVAVASLWRLWDLPSEGHITQATREHVLLTLGEMLKRLWPEQA